MEASARKTAWSALSFPAVQKVHGQRPFSRLSQGPNLSPEARSGCLVWFNLLEKAWEPGERVTHYPRFKATSKETRQPTALRGAKQPTLSQPTWLGSTCTAALLHGQTVPAGTLQAHPKSATTKLLAAAQFSALRRGLRKVRLCKRKRAIQWPIAAGGRSSALGGSPA